MRFIDTYRPRFGVEQLCRVLGMPLSTYYYHRARLARPVERREQDRQLLEQITAIWTESRFTYGSPRVHAQLARQGVRVGRKRVERLMREAGLRGAYRSRYFRTTESDPSARVAPDLVERDFHATAPDQLWVADFTYLRIDNGLLFLACVLDVFSRVVVGWKISDVRDIALVDDALTMALNRRGATHGLVHHSDRGSQGEINWSSQHLEMMEVLHGTSTTGSGSGDPEGDEVAWPSLSGQACGAGVLATDRRGYEDRGRRGCGRRVRTGRHPLVPRRWRHATDHSRRIVGPVPVVR